MARKPVVNEKNTKDHNTRAGKVVLERHKGKIAKNPPKMKTMQRKSRNG
jgi:hypothetical protein